MSFFSELKRRNVFRVAAAYLVASWLLIEVSATLEETLRLPEWADSLLAMFLILGFPVALFFSWAYEVTPEGIRREKDIDEDDTSRAATARRLDWAVIVMVAVAVVFFAVDRFVVSEPPAAHVAELEHAASDMTADAAPGEPTTESAADEAPAVPELSIAVLPFVNMSSDTEQEYFSDGLTEELLNLLAGIEELKVAARTSSFYYKDKLTEIPFKEIGRQLEVAHLLEGSVRKGGDEIRITAQLIKADDGYHMWSETYDRTLDDVFAIQDEIAAAVVEQLKITLLGEAPHAKVFDTESWELALQGRYLFGRRASGDLKQALELFEKAAELDPTNAAAWVGMAPLYIWLFDPPRIEDSINAARKAIELEPDNAEAWSRLSRGLNRQGDTEGGRAAWTKALELGDESPLIQSMAAGIESFYGNWDEAVRLQQKAVALDPLYIVNLGNLASFMIEAGQIAEAEEIALKTIDLAPTSQMGYQDLAHIRLLQGDPEEALRLIQEMPSTDEAGYGLSNLSLLREAMIHHSLGNHELAENKTREFRENYSEDWPTDLACILAWREQPDEAFQILNDMLDAQPKKSVKEASLPCFNKLHGDPRWDELMQRWTGPERVW